MKRTRETIRYSEAFKMKVVSELEKGKFKTMGEAARIYQINGSETIQNWLRKYGKNHLLDRVVRVQTRTKIDRIKQLEKEKSDLEKALEKSQIELMYTMAERNVFQRFVGKESAEELKKTSI